MGALVFKGHYTSYLLRTFGLGYELALNTIRPPLKGLMPRNYTFGVCGLPPWSERRLETFWTWYFWGTYSAAPPSPSRPAWLWCFLQSHLLTQGLLHSCRPLTAGQTHWHRFWSSTTCVCLPVSLLKPAFVFCLLPLRCRTVHLVLTFPHGFWSSLTLTSSICVCFGCPSGLFATVRQT